MSEFLVANEGGLQRSLLRHYDGGKLSHVRHLRENIDPHIKRAERLAKQTEGSKSEYQYLGSVPRVMIDDWLRKQGKNWNEYATNKDLKAALLVWFKTDCQKMMASHYQERRLSVNRSLFNRRGAKVLKEAS